MCLQHNIHAKNMKMFRYSYENDIKVHVIGLFLLTKNPFILEYRITVNICVYIFPNWK